MNWRRQLYNLLSPQRHGNSLFFERINGSTNFNSMQDKEEKLKVVLRSPAVLMVIKLQCDLFSLGKITVKDNPDAPSKLIDKLKQPNPFQGGRQFLWDYMFYLMTFGNSYLEAGSKVVSDDNNLYWLNNANIQFDDKLLDKLDIHYFSKKEVDKLKENTIEYHQRNGKKRDIRLDTLEIFSDLTNSTGNWYEGNGVLDALYKVVSNSEAALNAKNINLDFAGKFLVGGDATSDNIYEQPLGKGEQKSIEDSVRGGKTVTAVKSQVTIARYVDNIAQLELDDSFFASYYIIGKIFGFRREVLEANLDRGATFDNQDISLASHTEYTLQPKGDDLMDGLKNYFDTQEELEISWKHLLLMQGVVSKEADVNKTRSQTIKNLLDANVSIESINELLGIDLTLTAEPKEPNNE